LQKNFATQWLSTCWSDIILDISKRSKEFNYTDSTAMNQLAQRLLSTGVKDLDKCPRPIWTICKTIGHDTSIDVFQFLLLNLFAKAIERPKKFKLVDESQKLKLKQLGAISDIIQKYANEQDIKSEEKDEDVNDFYRIVSQWWMSAPVSQLPQNEVLWEAEKDALITLIRWMKKNEDVLKTKLLICKNAYIKINYKIEELLETLNPQLENPDTSQVNIPSISSYFKKTRTKKQEKYFVKDQEQKVEENNGIKVNFCILLKKYIYSY